MTGAAWPTRLRDVRGWIWRLAVCVAWWLDRAWRPDFILLRVQVGCVARGQQRYGVDQARSNDSGGGDWCGARVVRTFGGERRLFTGHYRSLVNVPRFPLR